jgi:transcriptional regulator with XRE-family HTH domain
MDRRLSELRKESPGPKNPQWTIDEIIRLMRERRFTTASFSTALGFTKAWGYPFMKNEVIITLPLLIKIANLLGVTAASLIPKEEGKMTLEEYVRALVSQELKKPKGG